MHTVICDRCEKPIPPPDHYTRGDITKIAIDYVLPNPFMGILSNNTDGLIKHYIEDFYSMESICKVISTGRFLSLTYDVGIFEGGQGLLLDEHNMKNFPHLTPSTTTPVPPS